MRIRRKGPLTPEQQAQENNFHYLCCRLPQAIATAIIHFAEKSGTSHFLEGRDAQDLLVSDQRITLEDIARVLALFGKLEITITIKQKR